MEKSESIVREYKLKHIKYFIIVITLVGSILGSLYSVYINSDNLECTTAVYTWFTGEIMYLDFTQISIICIKNFKKVIFIWIFSFYAITYMFSYFVIFCNIFAYSFTATTILAVLGLKGIWIVFLICGVQALIGVELGLNILIKNKQINNKIDYKYILNSFVIICSFVLILSLYDIISVNILNKILPQILQ